MTGGTARGEVAGSRNGWARLAGRPVVRCALITALALAADVVTKAWALSRLSAGRTLTMAGGLLRLQLVINHGAAFGLAAGYEPLLTAAAVAAVILLGVWAVRASGSAGRVGASLAVAGAAGNLIDRLARPPAPLYGGVVDWLHVPFYSPTFNLADVWLRAGLLIAAAGWLWRHRAPAA